MPPRVSEAHWIALLDGVFGDDDIINIIFSNLKPLSDKPRVSQTCRRFCAQLSEPQYNTRRNWLISRACYVHSFYAQLQRACWCTCGCLRVASAEGSSKISLQVKCAHFQRLLCLVKQTPGRSYDREDNAWTVATSHLRLLLGRVHRSEPDALLPRVREALARLEVPGPPEPTGPAASGDDPIRDYSRFGGPSTVPTRRAALLLRERDMRSEEQRLHSLSRVYFDRQRALQELREAVRVGSDFLKRVTAYPVDASAASNRLTETAQAAHDVHEAMEAVRPPTSGAMKPDDEALMSRARALEEDLNAEVVRAAAALAERARIEAVGRLQAAMCPRPNDEPLAERVHLLEVAIREAEEGDAAAHDAALLAEAVALLVALREARAVELRKEAEEQAAARKVARREAAISQLRDALADAVDGPVDRRLLRLEAALCEAKASGVLAHVDVEPQAEHELFEEAARLQRALVDEREEEQAREAQAAEAARKAAAAARAAARKKAAIERLSDAVDRADEVLDEADENELDGNLEGVLTLKDVLGELKAALCEATESGVTQDVPVHNSMGGEGLLDAAHELLASVKAALRARAVRLPRRECAVALCECNRPNEEGELGYHVCRFFGFFSCRSCGNSWESGRTHVDLGRKVPLDCRRCHRATEPFKVQLLQDGGGYGGRGQHPAHLCHMCRRLQRESGNPDARCDQ